MEDKQLLLTVSDARARLGRISHSKFYQLVKDGDIRLVKVGRRSYVTPAELARFVGSLAEGRG